MIAGRQLVAAERGAEHAGHALQQLVDIAVLQPPVVAQTVGGDGLVEAGEHLVGRPALVERGPAEDADDSAHEFPIY